MRLHALRWTSRWKVRGNPSFPAGIHTIINIRMKSSISLVARHGSSSFFFGRYHSIFTLAIAKRYILLDRVIVSGACASIKVRTKTVAERGPSSPGFNIYHVEFRIDRMAFDRSCVSMFVVVGEKSDLLKVSMPS